VPTFDAIAGGLRPRFPLAERVSARITLPAHSLAATRIEDARNGSAVDVSLVDALIADAEPADGYVVYRNAHISGATLLHRALPDGLEDFLAFDKQPPTPSVAYKMELREGVKGLRLVAGTLEILDAQGAPRLRVSPPYIVGADGVQTDATLAVEGCAVDKNPSAPWGRRVTAPGAGACTIRVSWPAESVKYPAVMDPRWTVTGSMASARQDHTAILLPLTGKVLVVGGRTSPTSTTGLATAELYDKTTGTWAATSSITGGRWSHTATLLNSSSNGTTSQKVLVAGGINGSTSLNTAQLYSQTAGTWAAAGNLNAARHLHSATLLADGRVLVAGGMNGTATLQTAALYNPASGSGTWTATVGPIPPLGQKNHTATLLVTSNQQLSNKVLFVGGNDGSASLTSVFLFDPVQSAFSTLAPLSVPREGHTATVLANGKVLIAGGKNGSTPQASALTFDPSTSNGIWASAGNMSAARIGHSASLLSTAVLTSGQVLVAGGFNGSSTVASTDVYKVATNSWAADSPMVAPVQGHVAVVLGSNVLIAGGVNGSTTVSASELYDPSFSLSCSTASQCASGFCVNGVCCDTACNQGCGACNLPNKIGTCSPITSGTACADDGNPCTVDRCDGTSVACQHRAGNAGTVCRAAAGECDVSEACNGTSTACPSDAKKASGTACTDDGNVCSKDQCDGSNVACQHPAGNAGTICRAAAGECDLADACTGASTTCPSDAKKASGTACTDDGNVCTADQCDGSSVACQHPAGNAGTICRAAAGECDVAETCTGSSTACPTDAKKPSGTACTDDGNACTKNQCDGTSVACQHPPEAAGTICRGAAGACDVAETCSGTTAPCPADVLVPGGTVCRPAGGECDLAEACSGTSPACPSDAKKASGTACTDDGDICTDDKCNGTAVACQHTIGSAGQVCVMPADTKVLAKLQVSSAVLDSVWTTAYQRIDAQAGLTAFRATLESQCGFDPLVNLESCLMAFDDVDNVIHQTPANFVTLCRGQWDRTRLEACIREPQSETSDPPFDWNGVTVFGGDGRPFLAFLSDDTLAFGSQDWIKEAIDRFASPSTPVPPGAPRSEAVRLAGFADADSTAWIAALAGGTSLTTPAGFQSLTGVTTWLDLRTGMTFTARLEASDASGASNIAQTLGTTSGSIFPPLLSELGISFFVNSPAVSGAVVTTSSSRTPAELLTSLNKLFPPSGGTP
jgi:hypothetical protein